MPSFKHSLCVFKPLDVDIINIPKSLDGRYLCHPIGVAYIQDTRVRMRRVSSIDMIPRGVRQVADAIKTYNEFIPTRATVGRFLAIGISTSRDYADLAMRFILVFIHEKIIPLESR